jgi:hypothetical protein
MKFRLEKKRKKIAPPSRLGAAIAPWRFQIMVGFMLLGTIAVLVTLLWYGTRIAALQITSVSVIGGSTIAHETIEASVWQSLQGRHYRLVPYTFSWWYPKATLEAMLKQMPRMKHVHTEVNDQELTVLFEEYQPFALWCETVTASSCLFIDTTGYAFTKAPDLMGSAFIRYIKEGAVPLERTGVFDPAFIATTGALAARLEDELNLYVTHVIQSDAVDTSYVLASGAEIKVSARMTADETFTNLKTIFASKDFSDLASGDFHYIDLRFGDKVFVSEVEVAASSSAATSSAVGASEEVR